MLPVQSSSRASPLPQGMLGSAQIPCGSGLAREGVLNDTTQGLAALARPLRTRHSGFAQKLPLREQHPSTSTTAPESPTDRTIKNREDL
ncbi:hypothetical protein FHG55_11615 [Pseudomonas jessenii]|uniref:Uncharacterized protein n=1 Tax=Pseudomonas jessenii TaxID=77298 RepID=A0A5C4KYZ7_PSEJE|nr:hypothetical protein FHG55_11615 [Pseudomonas jessenii]